MSRPRGRGRPTYPEHIRSMMRAESCIEKIGYDTRAEIAIVRGALAERGKKCRSYLCPECGKWHLTHQG